MAADDDGAMAQLEARLGLAEEPAVPPARTAGDLDELRAGTLTPAQPETVGRLRAGLLALAAQAGGAEMPA